MANNEPEALPSLNALAQYIKDLSFENPNAPASLGPQAQGPNISSFFVVNNFISIIYFKSSFKLEHIWYAKIFFCCC